jgi:hypothetical protein
MFHVLWVLQKNWGKKKEKKRRKKYFKKIETHVIMNAIVSANWFQ